MTPLTALIVSDGLPGHVNQARGLVGWLGNRFRVRTEELEIALRGKAFSRRALPLLLNRQVGTTAAASIFRLSHRGEPPGFRPDVVISAGGNTACANVLLARHWHCPNIFLGSKRHIDARCFTAHLTLEPTGEASNIVMNVAPSPLSEAEMDAKGRRFRAQHNLAGEALWLMACGGDGAGKTYRPRHWQAMGEWMNDAAERFSIRWLVSTSRRTGAGAEAALRRSLAPRHIAYGVWWSERPQRILGELMGAAERLFVTVDSMSMISECIASGKNLVLLHAGDGEPNQRYRDALAKYERLGVCRNASVDVPYRAEQGTDRSPPAVATLFQTQLDELERRIRRALCA